MQIYLHLTTVCDNRRSAPVIPCPRRGIFMKNNRHFTKRIISLLLSGSILASCFGSMSFTSHAAARPTTVINRLGLQAMRNVDLHRSDLPVYTPSSNKSSTAYSGRYDIYSTNYIYNQLSSAERKFWDGLDAVCYKLLSTKADAYTVNTYDSETNNASTEFVKYTGLSSSRATDIMFYFKYSNPQYYFWTF